MWFLLSDEWIIRCCLVADYWAAVAMLRCTLGSMIIRGLGTVTALVNTVCSCCGCDYRSWKSIHVNHIISLNDWWAHQLGASEYSSNFVVAWLSIRWGTVIVMHGELGRITEHWRSIDIMVLGLYLYVGGIYCKNPWYYWVLAILWSMCGL